MSAHTSAKVFVLRKANKAVLLENTMLYHITVQCFKDAWTYHLSLHLIRVLYIQHLFPHVKQQSYNDLKKFREETLRKLLWLQCEIQKRLERPLKQVQVEKVLH